MSYFTGKPTMTLAEAETREWPEVKVGKRYEFVSEVEQEREPPEQRLRRFTGQHVTVIATVEKDDPNNSDLFRVRADDGTEFEAWCEELNGWDKALGQFFDPEDADA